VPDGHEAVVVLETVSLQKEAEVEKRPMENAAMNEEKRDQEAAYSTVAVHERMDRLELRVGEPYVDERRHLL
jgi:hypothetical protein